MKLDLDVRPMGREKRVKNCKIGMFCLGIMRFGAERRLTSTRDPKYERESGLVNDADHDDRGWSNGRLWWGQDVAERRWSVCFSVDGLVCIDGDRHSTYCSPHGRATQALTFLIIHHGLIVVFGLSVVIRLSSSFTAS